jgi:hypothetical protein
MLQCYFTALEGGRGGGIIDPVFVKNPKLLFSIIKVLCFFSKNYVYKFVWLAKQDWWLATIPLYNPLKSPVGSYKQNQLCTNDINISVRNDF